MKIGELSKETGVSIRTLHHYDEIGLLKPSARSEADHRNYSKNDIERLHQIITLRGIGLSLTKIGSILGESPASVESIVERQIEVLEEEIRQRNSIVQRLKTSRGLLQTKSSNSVSDIISSISNIAALESNISHEEIAYLSHRAQKTDRQGRRFEEQANALIESIKAKMKEGTPATSLEMQELAANWIHLRDQMTNGDSDLNSRAHLAAENSPHLKQDLGVDDQFMAYLQEAANALKNSTRRPR